MRFPGGFYLFLMVQLFGTFLQVFTIQSNAWFMMTAVQSNDDMLDLWQHLWKKSTFGFLPEDTWKMFTPKLMAILLWGLSTTQLIWPLMFSVGWPGSKRSTFPTRSAKDARVTESAEIIIKQGRQWHQEEETELLEEGTGEVTFEPEEFCIVKFNTCWNKLVKGCLDCVCFHARESTYFESVASLSLASGLRYTGSMSLTYLAQQVYDIINFEQGYKRRKEDGVQTSRQGWELRALMEFQKLARWHGHRVFFVMFCKLALQMNLQITSIIILRIQQRQHILHGDFSSNTVMEVISIVSLLLTFIVEVYNVLGMICAFICVLRAVRGKVLEVGDSQRPYAQDDFVTDVKGEFEVIHHGTDLKRQYYRAAWSFIMIMLIIILSAWLVGYAGIKVICSEVCKSGAWAWESGCLPPMGEAQGEAQGELESFCFESFKMLILQISHSSK